MTLQELEQRLGELEREVSELRRGSRQLSPLLSVADTFGMFANDPEFEDVIRLGREYRNQINSETE